MTNLIDSAEESLVGILTPIVAAHTYNDENGEAQAIPCYAGKASTIKEAPNVSCEAVGEGEADPPFTGNYWVSMSVQVRYVARQNPDGTNESAADPKVADKALVSDVADALAADDLTTQLNNKAAALGLAFTVMGCLWGAPTSGRDAEGVWIDEFKLRLYCCATSLTA